jgi:hypothetical protein
MENNESKNQGDDVEFNWDAEAKNPKVSEGLKKLLSTGLSAVLMSEDGVRQYLRDINLPKDAIGTLLKGVAKSKEELVGRVGNEFSKLIEKIDVVEEVTKFLREHKVKVSAEFEFTKKSKAKEDDDL